MSDNSSEDSKLKIAQLQHALRAASEILDHLEERAATRINWVETASPPLFDDNRFAAVVAMGMEKARSGNG